MIDRKFQRPLHLFSWVACGAMTIKLVFFTEFNTRRPGQPHVFTGIQQYADQKLDEFFGVQGIADKAATAQTTDTDASAPPLETPPRSA